MQFFFFEAFSFKVEKSLIFYFDFFIVFVRVRAGEGKRFLRYGGCTYFRE